MAGQLTCFQYVRYSHALEDLKGAWPDRFSYDAVKRAYDKAVANGKADAFNQELMLRIMSQEDKLILLLIWFGISVNWCY